MSTPAPIIEVKIAGDESELRAAIEASMDDLNRLGAAGQATTVRLAAAVEVANAQVAAATLVARDAQEKLAAAGQAANIKLAAAVEVANGKLAAATLVARDAQDRLAAANARNAQVAANSSAAFHKMGAAGQVANARMAQAANDTGTSFRKIGPMVQQAGFQFQDFFIQVASGQDKLVAFAQQAPQFLGAFGPAGAVAGAVVAIGAVGAQMLFAADSAEKAKDAGQSLDDVMRRQSDTADDLTGGIINLANAYNEASEGKRSFMKLELVEQLKAEKKQIEENSKSFRDAIAASNFGSQVARSTDLNRPGSVDVETILRGGSVLDAELRRAPSLRDNPLFQVADQARVLISEGKLSEASVLLASFGESARKAAADQLKNARATDDMRRSVEQASNFLALVEAGLTGTAAATSASAKSATDATDVFMRMGSERAWIAAAREGEGALRALARQTAINTAETEMFHAANARAMSDGVVTPQELAEITNLVKESGDLAAARFNLTEGLSKQKQIIESLRGPMDRYIAKVKEIYELRDTGLLSSVDAARARAQAAIEMMRGLVAETEDALAKTEWARVKTAHSERQKSTDAYMADSARLLGPDALKRGEDAKRVLESIRTPMEAYAAEVDRLNMLLEKGHLSQDEYNAAVARADQDLERAVAKTDAYAAGVTALQQTLISSFSGVGDGLASSLLKGESALKSFGNLALNVVDRIIGAFVQMSAVNPLLNSLFSLGGAQALPVLGFSSGGWTGGQRNQIRGAVHGEEFVVRAPYAAQSRAALEALNRGQGLPGMAVAVPQVPVITMPSMASGPVTVNIHGAPAGSNPQVSQRMTAGGGREIDVLLESKMRDAMPRMLGDGSMDGSMRANFGVGRAPTRRG